MICIALQARGFPSPILLAGTSAMSALRGLGTASSAIGTGQAAVEPAGLISEIAGGGEATIAEVAGAEAAGTSGATGFGTPAFDAAFPKGPYTIYFVYGEGGADTVTYIGITRNWEARMAAQFQSTQGTPKKPESVAMSRSRRYFPNVNPIGQTFRSRAEPNYPEAEYDNLKAE